MNVSSIKCDVCGKIIESGSDHAKVKLIEHKSPNSLTVNENIVWDRDVCPDCYDKLKRLFGIKAENDKDVELIEYNFDKDKTVNIYYLSYISSMWSAAVQEKEKYQKKCADLESEIKKLKDKEPEIKYVSYPIYINKCPYDNDPHKIVKYPSWTPSVTYTSLQGNTYHDCCTCEGANTTVSSSSVSMTL